VKLQVVVSDDSAGTRAQLTGTLHFMNSDTPIRFGGGRRSPQRRSWDELAAAAAAVPGATVTYHKGT
jgi:hypothetical protein